MFPGQNQMAFYPNPNQFGGPQQMAMQLHQAQQAQQMQLQQAAQAQQWLRQQQMQMQQPMLTQMNPNMVAQQQQNVRREYFPLYDTVRLAAGAVAQGVSTWFAVALGGLGFGFTVGKTLADTNLTNPRRLPDEVEHHVLSIRVGMRVEAGTVQNDSVQDDIEAILDATSLQFEQPAFVRNYGNLEMYPAAGGIVANFAGQGTGVNVTNGVAAAGAAVRLLEPIILGRGQTFAFNLLITRGFTLTNTWRLRLALAGVQYRNIVQG